MEEIRSQLEFNWAELKLNKESELEKEKMDSDGKITQMDAAALIQPSKNELKKAEINQINSLGSAKTRKIVSCIKSSNWNNPLRMGPDSDQLVIERCTKAVNQISKK